MSVNWLVFTHLVQDHFSQCCCVSAAVCMTNFHRALPESWQTCRNSRPVPSALSSLGRTQWKQSFQPAQRQEMSQTRDDTDKRRHRQEMSHAKDITNKSCQKQELSKTRDVTDKRCHRQDMSQARNVTDKRCHTQVMSKTRMSQLTPHKNDVCGWNVTNHKHNAV